MGNNEAPVKAPFKMTPAVFHVLLAVADGETHGYRIMQEVAERSRGSVKLGPGSLYFTINRLTESGMIEESDQRPDPDLDDSRRKYYRLTEYGKDGGVPQPVRVLASELATLADIVAVARSKDLISDTKSA